MSAFVAMINLDDEPVDTKHLEDLTAQLAYRGPDRLSTWARGPVGLGHALFRTTREAAYDAQPASLDDLTWIAGDIRLDGREELVARLGETLTLRETPDAELLLRAYAAWGDAALQTLLGDFSFALWDGTRRRLLCASDPFGMRSLFYARPGNMLVVSDSLPCLRQVPGVSDRLDHTAVGDFLVTGSHTSIEGSQTMYADIRRVPPANALVLHDGRVSIAPYWSFPQDVPMLRYRHEQEYVEHFRAVFQRAVADRLRTDSVVVAMSGGMDSSAVAATVLENERAGGEAVALQAATVVFDRLPLPRERPFVTAVAEHLGIALHCLVGDDYPLLDPPVRTTAPLEYHTPALWADFQKLVASLGRVRLTGEAGDNLLLYTPVLQSPRPDNVGAFLRRFLRQRRRHGRFPGLGTGLLGLLGRRRGRTPPQGPYPPWLAPALEGRADLRERWRAWVETTRLAGLPHHVRLAKSLVETPWSPDDVLRPEGYCVPEARDPFLDLRLVRLVCALPPMPFLHRKHILREAMAGHLPESVLARPKVGLGNYHHALLQEADAARIDGWQASEELESFVVRSRVPRLVTAGLGEAESYVSLRPLLLDRWLRQRW